MNEDKLESRVEDHIENIKFVYKTHYKMGEWYEKFDRLLTLLVVLGTGSLTALIIWEAVTRPVLLTVAVVVAMISFGSAAFDFGKKSQMHFSSADEYHSLYEEFRDFYMIELNSGERKHQKEKFHELVQKRRRLKDKSPRTTNFWFNRLNHEKIASSIENDLSSG
jgi:hypothetical protein